MKHTFEVHVSQRDADAAIRRFLSREAGWGMVLALILCVAYFVYDIMDGAIGTLSVVILTLLAMFVLVFVVALVSRRKQVGDLLRRLGGTPVTYGFTDSGFAAESKLGSSTLKWEAVRKLWIDPDVTLIFYARNGYTTIPTPQIPAEALGFLANCIKRAGGKVIDNHAKKRAHVT